MKRVLTNGFLILLLSVVCSVACDKDETIDDEPTYEQPAPDDDNNGGDGGDEGNNGDEGGEGNEGDNGDNGDEGDEGGEGTPDVTGDEVPIPDDNFRAYCIENFDEDGDGIFSKSEASSVESLYIIYNEIKSLKGIEYFTALKTLHCYNNQLTALDVSKNTALETLYCNSNQLTTLDVSKNTALTYLDCYNNPLELLNLGDTNFTSQNFYNELGSSTKFKIISSKITKLDVRQNELQSLDVSECPALERLDCNYNQLTALNVSGCAALKELSCYNNQLTTLDVSKNTALETLYCYNNPLELLNLGDVNPTRYYSLSKYPYFYDGLLGSSTKFKIISSKITELSIGKNKLQSLDVSECPALETLNCYNNQLTTLDVSKNTALKTLNCYYNQLTALDVSKNTALETLNCYYNQLTALDVSGCAALKTIYWYDNNFEYINLGDANPTTYYYSSTYYKSYPYLRLGASTKFKIISNKITELDVSQNKLQSLDVSECPALTNLYCYENQLTTLVSKNAALETLNCSYNQLTTLDVSNNTALDTFHCYNNPLELLNLGDVNPTKYYHSSSSYNYLSYPYLNLGTSTKFKIISSKITRLDVGGSITYNNLQSLDVSECPALERLDCDRNQLTTLNVSGCAALTELYCNENQLTALDVSKNTALKYLDCNENQLTALDVSKNTALEDLLFCYNPLELLNLGDVNPTRYYYKSYSYKSYPYFYNILGSSTKFKIISSKITELDVCCNELQSLDVSECPALQSLSCYANQLTTLDVSKNTALETLNCYSNQLTKLDVSKNTALERLDCYSNQLTELNVSGCAALKELYCYVNQLTALDVSKNTALKYLSCYGNKLTALDVSKNAALTNLYCQNNRLTALDVSKNTALTELFCFNNPLELLNLGDVNPTGYYDSLSPYSSYLYLVNGLSTSTKFKIISSKLTRLDVRNNKLQSLDISECSALETLSCCDNPLELLNFGDVNPTGYYDSSSSYMKSYPYLYKGLGTSTTFKIISSKITNLDVSSNNLQSLDISECPALTKLSCYSNQLTELDVSKTNLGNSSETYPLRCSSMSTLQTLYLKTGWSINYITRNRSETYIPSQTQIVFVD